MARGATRSAAAHPVAAHRTRSFNSFARVSAKAIVSRVVLCVRRLSRCSVATAFAQVVRRASGLSNSRRAPGPRSGPRFRVHWRSSKDLKTSETCAGDQPVAVCASSPVRIPSPVAWQLIARMRTTWVPAFASVHHGPAGPLDLESRSARVLPRRPSFRHGPRSSLVPQPTDPEQQGQGAVAKDLAQPQALLEHRSAVRCRPRWRASRCAGLAPLLLGKTLGRAAALRCEPSHVLKHVRRSALYVLRSGHSLFRSVRVYRQIAEKPYANASIPAVLQAKSLGVGSSTYMFEIPNSQITTFPLRLRPTAASPATASRLSIPDTAPLLNVRFRASYRSYRLPAWSARI